VQVPPAYISSLVLTFFNILYVWVFLFFSGVFLHNRVATLVIFMWVHNFVLSHGQY